MNISIIQLRKNIFDIFNNVVETFEPVLVKTKKGNAVIMSQDDLNSLKETLYIMSDKKVYADILEGINESIEDCIEYNNDMIKL